MINLFYTCVHRPFSEIEHASFKSLKARLPRYPGRGKMLYSVIVVRFPTFSSPCESPNHLAPKSIREH